MKNGIIYGGLIGLSFLILAALFYYIPPIQPAFILVFCLTTVTLLVLGLIAVKKNMYGGSVNYAQLIFNGLYICVFAAIFSGIGNLIFLTTINTNFKENHLTKVREHMELAQIPEKEIVEELKIQAEGQDLRKITGGTFLVVFLVTMVTNTVACAFIRNKDTFTGNTNPTEEPQS